MFDCTVLLAIRSVSSAFGLVGIAPCSIFLKYRFLLVSAHSGRHIPTNTNASHISRMFLALPRCVGFRIPEQLVPGTMAPLSDQHKAIVVQLRFQGLNAAKTWRKMNDVFKTEISVARLSRFFRTEISVAMRKRFRRALLCPQTLICR